MPVGDPPTTNPTTSESTNSNVENPQPIRTIKKISKEESNRKFIPQNTIAFMQHSKNDTKYIHTILKSDVLYYPDEDGPHPHSVYHFPGSEQADDFFNYFDANKVSAKLVIKKGIDIEDVSKMAPPEPTETDPEWNTVRSKTKKAEKKLSETENQTNNETTIPLNNETIVKIHNQSTKPGNPLYIKSVFQNNKLELPTRQFYSHKFKTTTLEFNDKKAALLFIEKIPSSSFGEQASYELYKPNRINSAPRDTTQDWNAVIRGVDPEIDIPEFEKELKEHNISYRKIIRIVTANGDKTHMLRIFFDDEESTKLAIFNGITILGRRYRVEPPRAEARHIPCRKCSQYGHSGTQCKNSPICFKCGEKPGQCRHPPNANILYCATCKSNDHYTGQIRCRLYPRSNPTPEEPRTMPLIRQNITSPIRPSTTNFPPITAVVIILLGNQSRSEERFSRK